MIHRSLIALPILVASSLGATNVSAQTAPTPQEVAAYKGLHAAAHKGDLQHIDALLSSGVDTELRDGAGRTPLHVAAFASQDAVIERLARAGADLNALESGAYDIVTIAAVDNDVQLLELALRLGASAGNITSTYDGTALIAAAHLGHAAVVQSLIESEAPLDHINNLGWTALIEAVVLGDGGPDHVATVAALVNGGADKDLADRRGVTPLTHARERGYQEIVELLEVSR